MASSRANAGAEADEAVTLGADTAAALQEAKPDREGCTAPGEAGDPESREAGALEAVPLKSVSWEPIPAGPVSLEPVLFGPVPPGSVTPGPVLLGPVPLEATRLEPETRGAAPIGATASAITAAETTWAGTAPAIQWYPGHIARAEKALVAQLEKVDLVIEVRDARIPLATGHPRLQRWIRGRQHLLVLNRVDMVSPAARRRWDRWFRAAGQTPWWCDAKAGTGVKQLQQAAIRAGETLNARRSGRGMRPRPVRALMLGCPNVGKSALINRLVRQKVVESARRAGVTRSLRWVRLGQELDLLDAPGVLPPRLDDQQAALRLALCDDIGQAAYDTELVALAFLRLLTELAADPDAAVAPGLLAGRYGVEPAGEEALAEIWLTAAARRHTSGDTSRMAQRLLDDYRRLLLGPIALELPRAAQGLEGAD